MSDSPSIDFPDLIPAEGLELRRLRAPEHGGDATDVEEIDGVVPPESIRETFYYFTSIPAGGGRLAQFLAEDAPRVTYGVWNAAEPLGSTSLYNWDLAERTCMVGYTWLSLTARGTGANAKVKAALFATLARHGFTAVRLRADVANVRSRAAMRKIGAREAEVEPGPRLYAWDPERRSRSQYFVVEL